jgi:predicted phage-related endonuclease
VDRTTYLGSHAASSLLGRNPFSGKAEVYQQALGILPEKKPSQSMQIGLDFEDKVLGWYERTTGLKIAEKQKFIRHPKHEYIGGTADGIISCDPPHGVDAKVANPFYLKEWGSEDNQIPEAYYLQAQHFMLISGYARWDIFLSCGTHLKNYQIESNAEIKQLIEDTLVSAWQEITELRYLMASDNEAFAERMLEIAKGDEDARANIIKAAWPHARDLTQPCPPEHLGIFERIFEQQQIADAAEGNLAQLKNDIKAAMKDVARWRGPGGEIAWTGKGVRKLYIRPDAEHKA